MTDNDQSTEQVEPIEQTNVEETVPKVGLVVKNPYLTVRVEIAGLDSRQWVGTRVGAGKSARAWIRSRNLSVDPNKVPGVIKQEREGEGEEYESATDGLVKTDLLLYRFTHEAIEEADVTVTVPQKRAPRTKKKKEDAAPVVDANDVADAGENEESTPEAW